MPTGSVQHFLHGSITNDETLESLLHLLRGLCEDAARGSMPFLDEERSYTIQAATGAPMSLRARRSLLHEGYPWLLTYFGQTDSADSSRLVSIRTCVQAGTSDELPAFLTAIGFKKDFELVSRGHVFKKGDMRVLISKFYSPGKDPSHPDGYQSLASQYLVELSAISPKFCEDLAREMHSFAEQLKPLVYFEKFNPETL